MTVGEFRLKEECISIWVIQVILRGLVKHEPIHLPESHQITIAWQYRLPGGQDKISRMVQGLEKAGIIYINYIIYFTWVL